MADTTIEWCHKVWNVGRGCRRVSTGCGGPNNEGGCYAERQAQRFSGPGQPYQGLVTLSSRGPRWTGKARFVPEKLDEPLRWKTRRDGTRLRIFVDSMSDLFFEGFTNEQIAAVFGVMAACPQHDFLVLTKRPKRALDWFEWHAERTISDGEPWIPIMREAISWLPEKTGLLLQEDGIARHGVPELEPWPLPNVWLLVSCENHKTAAERIPWLLQCPAAVRGVSAEPLLGPIDLRYLQPVEYSTEVNALAGTHGVGRPHQGTCEKLDWVIVGSESGPRARPMALLWAESLRIQCKAADVAFFTKQIANEHDRKGGDPQHWPGGPWPREFPAV